MKNLFCIFFLLIPSFLIAKPSTTVVDLVPVTDSKEIPNFVSKLPKCKGSDPKQWHECVGGFVFPNMNSYYGEWRKGVREGLGQIKVVAKGVSDESNIRSNLTTIYVGEFQRNRLNGHGVWIEENGDRYEGEFLNNLLVQDNRQNTTVFGDDTDLFKRKCSSFGLKFGTADFANCMLKQEEMANLNAEKIADRSLKKELQKSAQVQIQAERDSPKNVQQISNETKAIDWFKLMNEIAKPQWIPNQCPELLNAPPGQYSGCR